MTARTRLLYSLAGVLIGVGVACSSPGSDELTAAREALGRGRYGEALERYTEVTIQAPGTPEAAQALYELALIHYLQRRDVDAARSTFRKILLSYPDSAVARDARRLLARMYSEDLGEPEKAIREYELLLMEETDPEQRKSLLLDIAYSRYTTGDMEGAAEAYRRVIEDFPQDQESFGAYLRLAHIQRLAGRSDEALGSLLALLGMTEDPAFRRKAYQMRAEALAELGRYEEARTCLTAAAEEFPGDPDMTELLVRIRDQENQRKLAEAEGELGEGIHWGSGRP